jgi:transcriptional regulator with XRE-family HTH domain
VVEAEKRRVLESIAANVRRLRLRAGLTQAQLAEAADLDLRQLQRIERAEVNFGVSTLLDLAEALGKTAGRLLRAATLPPSPPGRPPSRFHRRSDART